MRPRNDRRHQVPIVHYLIVGMVLLTTVVLAAVLSDSDEPDPEALERLDASSVKDALEGRVDELSDEQVLELWKTLRKDMKRRERRGVIFSERLKLEAEQQNQTLDEEFDRELQRELVALEESSSD